MALFDPGWLKKELDAASAEVKTWPAGLRRSIDALGSKLPGKIKIDRDPDDGSIERIEAHGATIILKRLGGNTLALHIDTGPDVLHLGIYQPWDGKYPQPLRLIPTTEPWKED